MLSINQKKHVNSLKQKKFRTEYQAFVVEGVKMVEELLQSDFEVAAIFATSAWILKNPTVDCVEITEKELHAISSLKTPNEVLAVVKQRKTNMDTTDVGFVLALDNIQDPGNLGTIIRTADWFGIQNIICSENTVDIYNPKVIQATMGSLFRINVSYVDLATFFKGHNHLTVYGALLDGKNVYQTTIKADNAVLLMGNESKGISKDLFPFITDKISIPKFGMAESLNVATATAILCSEYKRA